MTFLGCSNASGSHCCTLVLINKSAKSRCFKHMYIDTLPVHYISQNLGWTAIYLVRGRTSASCHLCAKYANSRDWRRREFWIHGEKVEKKPDLRIFYLPNAWGGGQIKDTLFPRDGSFWWNNRDVDIHDRSRDNQRRPRTFAGHLFNINQPECAVGICKKPKNQERIERNVSEWKRAKGFKNNTNRVNLIELERIHKEKRAEILYTERWITEWK